MLHPHDLRRPRDQYRGDYRIFLRNSASRKQPSQEDFETMLAFNMMVPPKVRANMGNRAAQHGRRP